MSRLIVKGLPKALTEGRLRELFGGEGAVTDCQLKFTRDGFFRRFAFVGFQTEREAEHAKKHLDKTFIGTARIQVRAFTKTEMFSIQ